MEAEQIIHFHDDDTPRHQMIERMGARDETFDLGLNRDTELGNFLERPIRIATISWSVGSPMGTTIDPWTLFLGNTNVQDRLRKYYLLRGDMNIKVVINGNAFYFGKGLISYHPMINLDSVFSIGSNGSDPRVELMSRSQLPSFRIDASASQGGEMVLPYVFHKNWLDITQNDWSQLGRVYINSFTDLHHANGGTDAIDVNVVAWMSDVKLTVPTTQDPGALVFQSGEYGRGIISKTASSIAGIAAALKNVPMIGAYARATEMGASTIANGARMLGFSRPSVLETTSYMKPEYAGQLSVTDRDETIHKLSLDSKNELSIDPRVVGICSRDEMDFSSFITKPSYLTKFTWSTSQSPGTLLWNSRVEPNVRVHDSSVIRLDPMVSQIPCGYLSQMFKYWCGDVIFRFSIVASNFHKGRIRITLDPTYFGGAGGDEWNAVYSRVVDISEERDFSVRVGWMQPEAWRLVKPVETIDNGHSVVPFTTLSESANGMIRVEVLNNLTTPNIASLEIEVLVDVEGGDNMRFMSPTGLNIQKVALFPTPFPTEEKVFQSGEMKECDTPSPCGTNAVATVNIGTQQDYDKTPLVYGGEAVTSLRALLKRYWFCRASGRNGTSSGYKQLHTFNYPNFLPYRGYSANGYDLTTAGVPYNFMTTNAINYFTPCYLVKRGSMRYKYFGDSNDPSDMSELTVYRKDNPIGSFINLGTTASSSNASDTASLSVVANDPLGSGASFTNVKNQPVAEVALPFYSRYRFAFARITSTVGTDYDDSYEQNHAVSFGIGSGSANASYLKQYAATGEDFMLAFLLNVPVVYILTTP